MKDKAWSQLGTSGGGNHFVEFGIFTLDTPDLGLEAGEYLALLSHSGSRGVVANVANYYSGLAKDKCNFLPKELKHLSWLDMGTSEGLEYWNAMNLMGDYAAANHDCIHRYIKNTLCTDVLLNIENHHNFAWKENHFGKDLYVHRKGATPADKGVLGIIPSSMADPAYIVEGLGNPDALRSASHGAGRLMSRTQAKNDFNWDQANKYLADRDVKLLSAGLDEVPMAYKDIHEVMANQIDLVKVRASFQPRLVKMAEATEKGW
jgi:tRNA-splicing ligase RtcB